MRSARAHIAAVRGTTLVELTVATAIMTTVFAAILPVFVALRNSTQVRRARLEMLQNARVLNEHLSRHLAQARRIVAVSPRTEDQGYLEFEAPDGGVYRWASCASWPVRWNTSALPATAGRISRGPGRPRPAFA
jgi:type II secretory pathway component PulJ